MFLLKKNLPFDFVELVDIAQEYKQNNYNEISGVRNTISFKFTN